jgi:hypothetical protein
MPIKANFDLLKAGLSPEQIALLEKTADGFTVLSSADVERLVPPSLLKQAKERRARKPVNPRGGPGTELKRLLAGFPFYIKTTPTCSCNARAKQMDAWGISGCTQRIELIVGWLKEEAEKRRLPFVEVAGRLLVRRAIAAAKKRNV